MVVAVSLSTTQMGCGTRTTEEAAHHPESQTSGLAAVPG